MSKYGSPEIYSRFLRKDWLKENNSRIHHKAFRPYPNIEIGRLEVSCYETQSLESEQIRQISKENNILPNNKPPVGHCSIEEKDFLSDKLSIDRNYIPERHINIIDWEEYGNKEDKIELATKLAELSSRNICIY